LADVGQWMHINGAAIYATGASPFKNPLPWGRATQKKNRLYLHVFDWPADGRLLVPISNKVQHARLLAAPGTELKLARDKSGVTLKVPAQAPDAIASVIALDLTGPVEAVGATH
jgi:alpha-L-fucosidase